MAILGTLDSGLRGNHDILMNKSIIDGFCAIIFTSTLGYGVIFSAIPVFIYQAGIAIISYFLGSMLPNELMTAVINSISSLGGILIMALGLNIIEISKIKVGNLLPGLIVIVLIQTIMYFTR